MTKGNLLIIDDEELLVRSIKFLMNEHAEKIFTAFNGAEGFKVLSEEKIHCVICDIAMPVMTGVELLRKVRAQGSDVPFIFYTAYDHNELMMQAAQLGAYDFLKKPDFDCLQEVVSRGLREGFQRPLTNSSDKLMSDYEKILIDLSKLDL